MAKKRQAAEPTPSVTFRFTFPHRDTKLTVTLAADNKDFSDMCDAFKWLASSIDHVGGKVDYDSVRFGQQNGDME